MERRIADAATSNVSDFHLVHEEGLEPTHLAVPEPKSGASTSSATRARGGEIARIAAPAPLAQPAGRALIPSSDRIRAASSSGRGRGP